MKFQDNLPRCPGRGPAGDSILQREMDRREPGSDLIGRNQTFVSDPFRGYAAMDENGQVVRFRSALARVRWVAEDSENRLELSDEEAQEFEKEV